MNLEGKVIGIDLGTTNSVVSIVEGNEPVVIPNQEGENKTPSVVAFLDNDECLVGEIARRQAATNPQRTISDVKRLMGRTFDDLEDYPDIFPYSIMEHEDSLLIEVGGLGYTPEQISALILKKLKEAAENYLGEDVLQAVITVPAHFDDLQRNATIEAAEMAGLKVLRLINEPTAAAIAYGFGMKSDNEEIIAVYDFGGGTFDISVVEISGKIFEVLTSTGDSYLGGNDLDNVLVNLIVEEFRETHGVNLTEDPVTLRRLKEVAEKAKCELSSTTQTAISLPFIAYKDGHPLHLDRVVHRDEFEELIEPFVHRATQCCKDALRDANLNKRDISKVILVGGSTRIPLVQDAVEDFFGLEPFKRINPDEVVALGAATQAGIFEGNIEEVVLLDVVPHSLGIEVRDNRFSRIIEKNSTIPIKAAKTFTTTEDNQTYVNIHILQGENEEATENRSLGKFTLTDIPQADRGVPRIRVTFFVNADGVMEISAEEMSTGLAKSINIVHSELTKEEKSRRKRRRQRRRRQVSGTRPGRESASNYQGVVSGQKIPGRASGGREGEPSWSPADSQSYQQPPDFALFAESPQHSRSGGMPSDTGAPGEAQMEEAPSQPRTTPHHHRSTRAPVRLDQETHHQEDSGPLMPPPPTPSPYTTPPKVHHQTRQPELEETYGSDSKLPRRQENPDIQEKLSSALEGYTPLDVSTGGKPTKEGHPLEEPTRRMPEPYREKPPVPWPTGVEEAVAQAEEGVDTPEAMTAYTKALEMLASATWINSRDFGLYRSKVLLHSMLGQVEETQQDLAELRDVHGRERGSEILSLHDVAVSRFSYSPVLLRERAAIKELIGELESACEDLEKAMREDPASTDAETLERLYRARIDRDDDPSARFRLVKLFLKTNRVDEAIEILTELQKHEPYRMRALKILGLCYWQKNLHYLAWQTFKQLEQNDEIRDILYRLAGDMEATGQIQNSLDVYEHLQTSTPDYRDISAKIKKIRYRLKLHREDTNAVTFSNILNDERFVILEEINRGSMGIIYKARDKVTDETVALKILNDYLCSDPSAVERFKREARAAKILSHPNIVRIHDIFESGQKRFLSMEFIEGTDLKRLLSERTQFDEGQLLNYLTGICDALAYAHKIGVIHRDIKPANVMITAKNEVKVTDFGIAKILKADESTRSGTAVIGTPLYMAPEQITGERVDRRTDIYSLGIMLYELTSGNPPFYLGNIEYHHLHTQPPPLPGKISPDFAEIIMKCIEKNVNDRYQSIHDVVEALNKLK